MRGAITDPKSVDVARLVTAWPTLETTEVVIFGIVVVGGTTIDAGKILVITGPDPRVNESEPGGR